MLANSHGRDIDYDYLDITYNSQLAPPWTWHHPSTSLFTLGSILQIIHSNKTNVSSTLPSNRRM